MNAADDFLAIVAEVGRARTALMDARAKAEAAIDERTQALNRLSEAENKLGERLEKMIGVRRAGLFN